MSRVEFPDWDIDLFVYLNAKHLSWLDPIMVGLSSFLFWGLSYLFFALLMIRANRSLGKIAAISVLLGLAANSLVNNLIKMLIMRPRPASTESITDVVYLLVDPGIASSFFSAHTSNSFCLALFVSLYFRNKACSFAVFTWASLVAYSRIYVGMHFPIDIFVGLLFGLLTGWLAFKFYIQYCSKKGLL